MIVVIVVDKVAPSIEGTRVRSRSTAGVRCLVIMMIVVVGWSYVAEDGRHAWTAIVDGRSRSRQLRVDSVPSFHRIAIVVYCTVVIASAAIVIQTIAIHKAVIVDIVQIIRTGSASRRRCLVGWWQRHHSSLVAPRWQCMSYLTRRLGQRVQIVQMLIAPSTSQCRWLLLSRTKQSTDAIIIGSTTIAIIVVVVATAATATAAADAAIRIVVVPTRAASTFTARV